MDHLRSLEGVSKLLSEKMDQNGTSSKSHIPRHTRSNSVPGNNAPNILIAISSHAPAPLAVALSNGIQSGYYPTLPSEQPFLAKSHSGFVSKHIVTALTEDIHIANLNGSYPKVQNVVSPSQSQSPPLSPTAWQRFHAENQYAGSNGSFNNQSAYILGGSGRHNSFGHNFSNFTAAPQSPSHGSLGLAGSYIGRGSLALDLSQLILDGEGRSNSMDGYGSGANSIGFPLQMSLDAMAEDTGTAPSNENNVNVADKGQSPEPPAPSPPFPLKKMLSNQSLFALYSGDEDVMSSTDDVETALNTALNAAIEPTDIPVLEEKCVSTEIEEMNFKEDFMEYATPQMDASDNLGNGASGIVRKAFHFRSCKMVAIKQCRSKKGREVDAFIKEGKLYQTLEGHPHIISMLGFGKDKENGNLAMAMEYMDLASLDTLHIDDDHKLSVERRELCVAHIVYGVLQALATIHEHGIVHNDIKPHNILSNKYGEIKLGDFGTALTMHGKKRLTKNCGTQRYQSPEKVYKQPLSFTTKTDLWSLGVTAYELLFGDKYNADDELAFVTNIPQLNSKEYGVSAECCHFIQQCLTYDDGKRPSAQQLLKHDWFTKRLDNVEMSDKWPWFVPIEQEGDDHDDEEPEPEEDSNANGCNNNTRKRAVAFLENGKKKNNKSSAAKRRRYRQRQNAMHQVSYTYYNEEMLFMISALIIYYCTQQVNLSPDEETDENMDGNAQQNKPLPNRKPLHRRVSQFDGKGKGHKMYTDDERITNMAKYAYCSKEMVLERIAITVNYIKSQINKIEKL
eukprot:CAMPEP_0197049490 /NCGR_PEP_ID=MMETSP1384-20130603/24623_1 /TAXON_ID=29189 /ORGANISM="Ammonia sp." /LENGTH=790 /DNA_ID=CAMNT_0042481771 /DNA_START=98 /DNA_END=2470 /DNA_ORIENTATION=+